MVLSQILPQAPVGLGGFPGRRVWESARETDPRGRMGQGGELRVIDMSLAPPFRYPNHSFLLKSVNLRSEISEISEISKILCKL
jgi:hypothetical protein